jgi:hypothetical protein
MVQLLVTNLAVTVGPQTLKSFWLLAKALKHFESGRATRSL